MQAAVFDGIAGEVIVREGGLAGPGPGEVEVAIAAAGVCHSDLHVVRGEWSVPTPIVLGHEGSATVVAVGEGVDELGVGDHVVLARMASCRECRYCLVGRPAQCARWNEIIAPRGVLFDGTSRLTVDGRQAHHHLGVSSFAERAVVPASGAIKVRSDAPLDLLSLMGCAVATGVGAVLNTARVPAGSTVAVIGCGGVGLSVIQGARIAGATTIVAVDVVAEKLASAARLGATDTVDASKIDTVGALHETVPDGLDFVFDVIGKVETTEQATSAIGLGGAAVIVGLPRAGVTARYNPLSLATNDQRILGSNYGSINPAIDIPKYVDFLMDGLIDLESMVSDRLPLSAAPVALVHLAEGSALRQLLIP